MSRRVSYDSGLLAASTVLLYRIQHDATDCNTHLNAVGGLSTRITRPCTVHVQVFAVAKSLRQMLLL